MQPGQVALAGVALPPHLCQAGRPLLTIVLSLMLQPQSLLEKQSSANPGQVALAGVALPPHLYQAACRPLHTCELSPASGPELVEQCSAQSGQ